MNEKAIRILALLLAFSMAMACAFNLILPRKSSGVPLSSKGQPDNSPETSSRSQPPAEPRTGMPTKEKRNEISAGKPSEDETLGQIRWWARQDPDNALAWGQQQRDGVERSEALTDACFQIAQSDPKRGVVLAEKFKLNKDAVLENLAQLWAAKDLTAAYDWIDAQPSDDRRDALITGMGFVWSQKEPLEAAQFVVQQMNPGSAQDEAVMMVLHQWALTDLAAANSWVQQFPESPLRNRAMNELTGIASYQETRPQTK